MRLLLNRERKRERDKREIMNFYFLYFKRAFLLSQTMLIWISKKKRGKIDFFLL